MGKGNIQIDADNWRLLTRAPSGKHAKEKARIAAAVRDAGPEIIELSHRIHSNPEVALEEELAAGWVAEIVARHGYAVEHPAGRLPTAVRGILRGGVGEGRRVAILAEYDALPGIGHGCGHNCMAAGGVGAAIGLAAVAPVIPGEIWFLGTPAEERFSGKGTMIDDHLFEGLDAALLYHPSDRTQLYAKVLALEDIDVEFLGREAHASGSPSLSRNALDAMTVLLVSIGLWRQQLPPGSQVHGIVTEGGDAPNTIPGRTAGRFIIRSPTDDGLQEMERRFRDLVAGAALASACKGSAKFHGRSLTMRNNTPLLESFRRNLGAYGIVEDDRRPDPDGSTDMGNVSKVVPAIHPWIAICDAGTPKHSTAFRAAAVSPRADLVTLVAATVLAQTAFELLVENSLSEAAWHDFGEPDALRP